MAILSFTLSWFRDHGHLCILFKTKTNLTGSGLIVGFANASTEILAGIGIFAALGFMAHAAGTEVKDVVSGGIDSHLLLSLKLFQV